MNKDTLFLLRPLFPDPKVSADLFHCAACAQIEGLLSFFPFLRTELDIHYIAFPRPRADIIALLGEGHQGCPVLVLAEDNRSEHPGILTSAATGRRFISDEADISAYLAAHYGISRAHP
jgi:hypothetical protein